MGNIYNYKKRRVEGRNNNIDSINITINGECGGHNDPRNNECRGKGLDHKYRGLDSQHTQWTISPEGNAEFDA